MRNKVIVNLDSKVKKSIYEMIAEEGNCEKISLTDEDINYLINSGYLIMINRNNNIAIDIYEEEMICDADKLKSMLDDTKKFMINEINKGINNDILGQIEKLLEFAISKSCCIYFIL